jgi:hypothetical protein
MKAESLQGTHDIWSFPDFVRVLNTLDWKEEGDKKGTNT